MLRVPPNVDGVAREVADGDEIGKLANDFDIVTRAIRIDAGAQGRLPLEGESGRRDGRECTGKVFHSVKSADPSRCSG